MEGGVATTTSGDGSSSTSEDDVNNNPSKPVDGTTTYRLNHDVVLEVAAPEQWLCVSRMPLDMHASELSSLLEQFGPVKVIKTVHSQRSGEFHSWSSWNRQVQLRGSRGMKSLSRKVQRLRSGIILRLLIWPASPTRPPGSQSAWTHAGLRVAEEDQLCRRRISAFKVSLRRPVAAAL